MNQRWSTVDTNTLDFIKEELKRGQKAGFSDYWIYRLEPEVLLEAVESKNISNVPPK